MKLFKHHNNVLPGFTPNLGYTIRSRRYAD